MVLDTAGISIWHKLSKLVKLSDDLERLHEIAWLLFNSMIIESRSGVVDTSFPPNLMSDRRNTRAKGHTDRILWFLFDTFFIYLEIEYIIKKTLSSIIEGGIAMKITPIGDSCVCKPKRAELSRSAS